MSKRASAAAKSRHSGERRNPASASEFPPNWKPTSFKDICVRTKQWSPSKEHRTNFKYIDVSAVSRQSCTVESAQHVTVTEAPSRARKVVRTGDSLYATVRPSLRRIAFISPEYDDQIASTAFCVLRPNRSQVEPQFVYYLLQTDFVNNEIAKHESGASYPAVNDKHVLGCNVWLPPKPEQQKITAILWKLQRAIATQDQLIKATADLKQSAMQRLFTHGLNGEPLKDTEIGSIPESWQTSTLGELCSKNNGAIQTGPFGSQLHAREYRSQGTPVVNPTHLLGNRINHEAVPKISAERASDLARHTLHFGDVLFARRGQIGRHGFVSTAEKGWLCGTGCFLVRVQHPDIANEFLPNYFSVPGVIAWLEANAAGAIMPNLNHTVLSRLPIYFPVKAEQRAIASALATLDCKLAHHRAKRAALDDLFQTLLHQLMTAHIRVADLDIDTSEVTDHFDAAGKMIGNATEPACSDPVPDVRNMVGKPKPEHH